MKLIRTYKLEDPSQSIPRLKIKKDLIITIDDGFWRANKIREVEDIIYNALDYF